MDVDCKTEEAVKLGSPSESPTLDVPQKSSLSPTPTPPPQSAHDDTSTNGTTSKASTPPLKQPKKPAASAPQLIGDLPVARQEALKSFDEIPDNNYQYKTLGRSRELLESMTCDCTYEHGIDNEDTACGPYSDCINRLTQVECLPGDCRCRSYCQNQRFQRKQYANIEIVLTEKKGYGLRAEEDLPKDTFIYEYVGDVVNPASFKKRMREYAQDGIQHFYFMMLQKDEASTPLFIDATKSGGIGRFANHSCNPNCYVAKWTVGERVRMGIFAKRLIRRHEELTFNYNVDRYGHQAQTCYCGEPNCVGYIGGKTQTEFAAMDDLYLDALGITDENELMELKGTKKKKGKKIDDPDFMPTMKPVIEKDVPKVVQAIRQTTSRKVLYKILTRIKITEDQAALRQLMRLRGYSIMTNVLNDYKEDLEIVLLALECMDTWPLMNKNKVEDSQVYLPVEEFVKLEDERAKSLAQKLLDHWNTLPTYNRIPKRLITVRAEPSRSTANEDDQDDFSRREQEIKRARLEEEQRAKEPTPEDKAEKGANKEKRLLKLVGAVVVKSMSKYAKGLGKEDFKKYAKELTHLIAEKEKKSASYKENRLEALSDEKVTKIKKFCRDYITKLLRKLEKSSKGQQPGSSSRSHHDTPSTSGATPNSGHDDAEKEAMEMSLEEAMGMDMDGQDGEAENGYGYDDMFDESRDYGDDGPRSSPPSSAAPTPSTSNSVVAAAYARRKRRNDPGRSWDEYNEEYMYTAEYMLRERGGDEWGTSEGRPISDFKSDWD
ncbi:Histone-lysine N-methyltransferase, H3 lysine-36 specific [Leucoagaricus sp. SymC.cos]|nr:Histone-lysine N-methyltransferase, H3 lysine-36 specific [Leucoagaricus sp. SymC.cos]